MSYSLSNIKYISNNLARKGVGKSRDEKEKSKKVCEKFGCFDFYL